MAGILSYCYVFSLCLRLLWPLAFYAPSNKSLGLAGNRVLAMILTSLGILTVTYFSSRHYRKKAVNNLSETGKQKETQFVRQPKLFLGKESYTQKGLKYRTIVWAIVIVGLVLAVVVYFIHF